MSSAAGHKERSRVLLLAARATSAGSSSPPAPARAIPRTTSSATLRPPTLPRPPSSRGSGIRRHPRQGDLYNHESLVVAMESADVVISAVGYAQLPDQTRIISAIKDAGNINRFFPSEFGNDVDRVHAVEPAKSVFAVKASIRRAVEAEGSPTCWHVV